MFYGTYMYSIDLQPFEKNQFVTVKVKMCKKVHLRFSRLRDPKLIFLNSEKNMLYCGMSFMLLIKGCNLTTDVTYVIISACNRSHGAPLQSVTLRTLSRDWKEDILHYNIFFPEFKNLNFRLSNCEKRKYTFFLI